MLDVGNLAFGNVRIRLDLRWWRNGRWKRGARHCRDVGNVDLVWNDVGNVGLEWNVGDIGNAGHVRDVADLGPVGNVRRRFEQRVVLLYAYVNVADRAGWRRTHRNSSGIDRNWQSWGELRSGDTNDERTAHRECRGSHCRGANRADGYVPAPCYDDSHAALPNHRTHIDFGVLI
jgi:hypothetical protein